MYYTKTGMTIVLLMFFSLSFSQKTKTDSLRGDFTYLLKFKPNSLTKDYTLEEMFSLQISDTRAYFISENKLKIDSLFKKQFDNKIGKNFEVDMRGFPASKFTFLIIQESDQMNYYQLVGKVLLSYKNPIVANWKLLDETKIINTVVCKKAEVRYKGRDWTAWYSPDIPFPYGPYKFSGLPGLIVKITDKTGDYDFELVKSAPHSNLKNKLITIPSRHFENSKLVTKKELDVARENMRQNARKELESMGTVFSDNDNGKPRPSESEKPGYNPIELEE